jgi:hypothetical protein
VLSVLFKIGDQTNSFIESLNLDSYDVGLLIINYDIVNGGIRFANICRITCFEFLFV